MVVQHKSPSKDIQIAQGTTYSYHQVLVRWNHQWMAHRILLSLGSMPITRRKHRVSTSSVKRIRERSQLLKSSSLGTNREVNNARDHLRRTIRTDTRLGLCTRRSVLTNTIGWKYSIYNVANVSINKTCCVSQWSISRTTEWIGNKCDRQ